MTPAATVLKSTDLCKSFGDYTVLKDISMEVGSGEIVGVLGPNGAGKTTLMNLLTGALSASTGRVHLLGDDITELDTAQRCHRGLARTHQVPRPFAAMTVFENVLVAVNHGRAMPPSQPLDEAWQVLEETQLAALANRSADSLGLLDRKRLELSRALATAPKILLLDEIGGGLNDAEGDRLVELLMKIHDRGIALVWIEHIMRLLLRCCTRLICMAGGEILADGEPQSVMQSPQVQRAYFGAAT